MICIQQILPSSPKVLCWTRSFPPRKTIKPSWNLASSNGPGGMVFLPCRLRTSPTWANAFGNNTLKKSPAISLSPPSPPSKDFLQVPSFTAKTSKLRRYESTALASTTKQSKTPSWTHPFSNRSRKTHPQSSTHSSHSCPNNMANHTHGPPVLAANFRQDTSWPKRKRPSKLVDLSSLLWIPLSDQCSTSWLGWSFNLSW